MDSYQGSQTQFGEWHLNDHLSDETNAKMIIKQKTEQLDIDFGDEILGVKIYEKFNHFKDVNFTTFYYEIVM